MGIVHDYDNNILATDTLIYESGRDFLFHRRCDDGKEFIVFLDCDFGCGIDPDGTYYILPIDEYLKSRRPKHLGKGREAVKKFLKTGEVSHSQPEGHLEALDWVYTLTVMEYQLNDTLIYSDPIQADAHEILYKNLRKCAAFLDSRKNSTFSEFTESLIMLINFLRKDDSVSAWALKEPFYHFEQLKKGILFQMRKMFVSDDYRAGQSI